MAKRALITGASSGLGREFAKQLHTKGLDVTLVARRRDRLEVLSNTLNTVRAGSAEFIEADLSLDSLPQSLKRGVARVEEYIRKNEIHILVNNAGFGSFGSFDELSLTREVEMVKVNAIAPIRLCHAVLPQMKQRKEGAIINVSSVAAMQPIPYMSSYSATKAFDLNFSLGLRYECMPYGIKVLVVCPGPVHTEFGEVANFPDDAQGMIHDVPDVVVKKALKALDKNCALSIPGLIAKLSLLPTILLPRTLSTRLVAIYLQRVKRKLSS